jgi:hypothetical protein
MLLILKKSVTMILEGCTCLLGYYNNKPTSIFYSFYLMLYVHGSLSYGSHMTNSYEFSFETLQIC